MKPRILSTDSALDQVRKRPNQAIQLTADRSVTTQDFMREFAMLANLGLVSGS